MAARAGSGVAVAVAAAGLAVTGGTVWVAVGSSGMAVALAAAVAEGALVLVAIITTGVGLEGGAGIAAGLALHPTSHSSHTSSQAPRKAADMRGIVAYFWKS